MTYADYRLGKALRALSESFGRNREWLEGAEVYLFSHLREGDVPKTVRNQYLEFQVEIVRLQAKYRCPRMHISAALFADDEVTMVMKLFVDLVASWPGSVDMYW